MPNKSKPSKLQEIEDDSVSEEDTKSSLDEEYFANRPPVQKINSSDIVKIKSKDDCNLPGGDHGKTRNHNRTSSAGSKENKKAAAASKISQSKVNKPHTITSRNIVPQDKISHNIPSICNARTVSNVSTRTAGSSIYSEILPLYSQQKSSVKEPKSKEDKKGVQQDSDDNEEVSWCSCC